jgi:putative flippase GtrA
MAYRYNHRQPAAPASPKDESDAKLACYTRRMYEAVKERFVKYLDQGATGTTDQFVRYFVVALLGLVVDFATLVILHDVFHVFYLIAAAGGFVAGLIVNYLLSSKYVFKDSKINSKMLEFLLFGAVGLIGLGILSLSMWVLVSLIGVQYLIAKCLATVVVYVWNFVGRKAMYRN